MAAEYDWLLSSHGPAGDPQSLFELGNKLKMQGELKLSATAYDRAFGLRPDSQPIAQARQELLDSLAVRECGITFRYIPAGSFLMGSANGELDEQPVHPVELSHYWLSETPVSWAKFCDLMDWKPAPDSIPQRLGRDSQRLGYIQAENKIRLQYCEDATIHAVDWHAHEPEHEWRQGDKLISSRTLFGTPPREDPGQVWGYDHKPMVSVSWREAEEVCAKISSLKVQFRLPTEAEWEKAARGGLIDCSYPWGNETPSEDRCDFNRFDQFSILPMRRFAANGYGLYAMAGCVWEWTSDWYDAKYYSQSEASNPGGPSKGKEKVLRGGSWSDCREVLTVSFRMSRAAGHWRQFSGEHFSPNIGFRICRVEPVSNRRPRRKPKKATGKSNAR